MAQAARGNVSDRRDGGLSALRLSLAAWGAAVVLGGVPAGWHAPRPWLYEAWCLHDGQLRDKQGAVIRRVSQGEGAWDAIGYVHGKATYGGGLQFTVSTWQSVGGAETSVQAIAARPPREQLYRAWLVYRRDGNSWREWSSARACGLR